MSKLNEKQKAFADYYIESLNATESYKKVYECSYNTARTNGARLLTNANIKKYIDEVGKHVRYQHESIVEYQEHLAQSIKDLPKEIVIKNVLKIP